MFLIGWHYSPYFKARLLLSSLDYHRGRNDDALGPSMGGLQYWDFSLNTFTDDIETWCIKSLYNDICSHLQSQFGTEALSSYTYEDQEGWPRQATIVQLRKDTDWPSYLVVTALQNNDNDMIRFSHFKGVFDTSNKHQIPSWELRPHILRGLECSP